MVELSELKKSARAIQCPLVVGGETEVHRKKGTV